MSGEKEILKALQEDLNGAFADLIKFYENSLLNFAYRLTGDLQGAQDIVQEVFLKFYVKFDDLLPIEYLTALLYRMTSNLAKNYIRDRARKREVALAVDSSSTTGFSLPIASKNDGNDNYEDLKAIVLAALDNLPEKQRLAFVLKVFENKTYDEIAQIFETSRNNVMVLIHRAHTALASDKNLIEYLKLE